MILEISLIFISALVNTLATSGAISSFNLLSIFVDISLIRFVLSTKSFLISSAISS